MDAVPQLHEQVIDRTISAYSQIILKMKSHEMYPNLSQFARIKKMHRHQNDKPRGQRIVNGADELGVEGLEPPTSWV